MLPFFGCQRRSGTAAQNWMNRDAAFVEIWALYGTVRTVLPPFLQQKLISFPTHSPRYASPGYSPRCRTSPAPSGTWKDRGELGPSVEVRSFGVWRDVADESELVTTLRSPLSHQPITLPSKKPVTLANAGCTSFIDRSCGSPGQNRGTLLDFRVRQKQRDSS